MVDTKEVKYIIKFSGWGTPQSAIQQQSSDTAAPSTAAMATSTRIPIATTAAPSRPATATTTRVPMATTAAPSTEATAGTSNKPNTASPSAKKHYKISKCPLCKKDQTRLDRHLLVHVRKGEISKDRRNALIQYADKRGSLYREE